MIHNFQKICSELKRLRDGKIVNNSTDGQSTIKLEISCKENSEKVLINAKSVMIEIDQRVVNSKKWLSDDEWLNNIPGWFIDNCAKEQTDEETEKWLKWWKSQTIEKQSELEKNQVWSFINWIYWLEPSRRTWYWWDFEIVNPNHFTLDVEVEEWPFPWGALRWLLIASGALNVEIFGDSQS
jgi:hypothetical protein